MLGVIHHNEMQCSFFLDQLPSERPNEGEIDPGSAISSRGQKEKSLRTQRRRRRQDCGILSYRDNVPNRDGSLAGPDSSDLGVVVDEAMEI